MWQIYHNAWLGLEHLRLSGSYLADSRKDWVRDWIRRVPRVQHPWWRLSL